MKSKGFSLFHLDVLNVKVVFPQGKRTIELSSNLTLVFVGIKHGLNFNLLTFAAQVHVMNEYCLLEKFVTETTVQADVGKTPHPRPLHLLALPIYRSANLTKSDFHEIVETHPGAQLEDFLFNDHISSGIQFHILF